MAKSLAERLFEQKLRIGGAVVIALGALSGGYLATRHSEKASGPIPLSDLTQDLKPHTPFDGPISVIGSVVAKLAPLAPPPPAIAERIAQRKALEDSKVPISISRAFAGNTLAGLPIIPGPLPLPTAQRASPANHGL